MLCITLKKRLKINQIILFNSNLLGYVLRHRLMHGLDLWRVLDLGDLVGDLMGVYGLVLRVDDAVSVVLAVLCILLQ